MSTPILKCTGCPNVITNREYLICSICTSLYDLDCANVSYKLFTLMTKESKSNWKCIECVLKKPRSDNTNTPIRALDMTQNIQSVERDDSYDDNQSYNNVTIRKRQTNSIDEETIEDSLQTTSSFRTLSLNDSIEIEELKAQINQLSKDLEMAKLNIQELRSENVILKMTINEIKKKEKSTNKQSECYNDIHEHKDKTTISNSRNKKNKKGKNKNTPVDKILQNQDGLIENQINTGMDTKICNQSSCDKKICMISSNKRNDILKLAERNFCDSEIFHYLNTNANIQNLLLNIDLKLKNFTLNDYCVIFIGENDFMCTEDYSKLIMLIRTNLLKVQNTNVIICLPNYKYGRNVNIFNKRVEVFNNMLYLDNETHQYAYILDSNKKLKYSYETFRFDGSVNRKGMNLIFSDLYKLIHKIDDDMLIILDEPMGDTISNVTDKPHLFRE